MFRQRTLRLAPLVRWFFLSGGIGLAVAIVAADLMSHDLGSLTIFEVLWPSSVVGVIDPISPTSQLLVALMMYGGQFVLYGVIGSVVMVAAHEMRPRRPSPRTPQMQ